MQPVTIIGGGLAGLALGIGLRKRGVPARIFEAKRYPRHKVCGEFICGARENTYRELGIDFIRQESLSLSRSAWFEQGRTVYVATLPRPALGISRHRLDAWLADHFRACGGVLEEASPVAWREAEPDEPGWVWTSGRHVVESPWIGLKMHVSGLHTDHDLELHLGHFAYAGVSAVGGDRFNVCGLFRKRPGIRARRDGLLPAYMEASGLQQLARRIREAEPHPESATGIDSISFTRNFTESTRCYLGDHITCIPPFTGNGMSIALETAAAALDPLEDWSRDRLGWQAACVRIRRAADRLLFPRIATARGLHPMIYHPWARPLLRGAARAKVLPFRLLFHLTH